MDRTIGQALRKPCVKGTEAFLVASKVAERCVHRLACRGRFSGPQTQGAVRAITCHEGKRHRQGSQVPKSEVSESLKRPCKKVKDGQMGKDGGQMGGKWGEMGNHHKITLEIV